MMMRMLMMTLETATTMQKRYCSQHRHTSIRLVTNNNLIIITAVICCGNNNSGSSFCAWLLLTVPNKNGDDAVVLLYENVTTNVSVAVLVAPPCSTCLIHTNYSFILTITINLLGKTSCC